MFSRAFSRVVHPTSRMMSVMSKPATGRKGYQVTKVVCAGAAVAGFAAMSEHINAASGEEGVSAQKIAFGGAAAVLAAGLGYFVYSQVVCDLFARGMGG